MLFHCRLGEARDADAVAAHQQRRLFALLVGEASLECVGVFAAELEDVAHLNAPPLLKDLLLVVERPISGSGIAQISLDLSGHGAPRRSPAMLIGVVGATDEALKIQGGWVRQAFKSGFPASRLLQCAVGKIGPDRAEGQGCKTLLPELLWVDRCNLQCGGPHPLGHGIRQLDVIQLLVSSQADQQRLLSTIVEAGQQHQHLDGLRWGEVVGRAEILNRCLSRRVKASFLARR